MKDVIIYSSEDCVPCKDLKLWLDNNRYSYTVLDRDTPEHTRWLLKHTGQYGVPTVVIGEQILVMPPIWKVRQVLEQQVQEPES